MNITTEKVPTPVNKTIENTKQMLKDSLQFFTKMKESQLTFIVTVLIFILLIIGLLVYLYYSVYLKKRECSISSAIYGDINKYILNIDFNNKKNQYTFKDYYIKSAYNACSIGNYKNDYVDTCILKDIIKQGVRGLDFEIFSIGNQPVVATSTSDSFYVKETFNYVPFSSVMSIINNYAFTNSSAPNPLDPIIIHLRIKSNNQTMFTNFAKILEPYVNSSRLLGPEYSLINYNQNFGDIPLSKLKNKIVIIVDGKDNNSPFQNEQFIEYINMKSNGNYMRALHYYDIKNAQPSGDELITFNKTGMTLGMPDKGENPPNPSSIVMRETGCQLIAMRYQLIDGNIEINNIFFDDNNSAFVLKPDNLRYIPDMIPIPPMQNPQLSYATRTIQSDFYKFDI